MLNGTERERIDPLDVAQWTFHVLPTSVINQKALAQKTIRLGPLKALKPCECEYDELGPAIRAAAAVNRGGRRVSSERSGPDPSIDIDEGHAEIP